MSALFPKDVKVQFEQRWAGHVTRSISSATVEPPTLDDMLNNSSVEHRAAWQRVSLGYTSDQGDITLREHIAADYPGLGPEHILTFCGAQEALFCACHSLLRAGDKVLCIEPGFGPLRLVPQSLGCDVVGQALDIVADRWRLDVDALCQRLAVGQFRMLCLNFPHNPTGAHLSESELRQILVAAEAAGTWVLSDEVFRGLEFGELETLPTAAGLSTRALSIGAMGKALGLGGVRIGWLACADQALVRELMAIKSYLSFCNSSLDEAFALLAWPQVDDLLAVHRQQLRQNLAFIESLLSEASLPWRWLTPQAGCTAFPLWTGPQNAAALAEYLAKDARLMLLSGCCFAPEGFLNHVRIGFGRATFADSWRYFAQQARAFLALGG